MEIKSSIIGLTKSNNGFFKSDKQADFLTNELMLGGGYIGIADSGYDSCPIFAKWDKEGIIQLYKYTKNNGNVVIFDRKITGILTNNEIKEQKVDKRLLKKLERQLEEKILSYEDGTYNGSGDKSTYTTDMTARYEIVKDDLKKQIENLKTKIEQDKN